MELKDKKFREICKTEFSQNLIVEAGAGTGKTTLLVARLIVLLLKNDETDITQIVALTFTEKAASEMKIRLATELQKIIFILSNGNGDDNETISILKTKFHQKPEDIILRAQKALEKLDRAQISTIHSFCSYILKNYSLQSGISPVSEIDDGSLQNYEFDKHWDMFLDVELAENSTNENKWMTLLKEINLQDIKKFANYLSSSKLESYIPNSHQEFIDSLCKQKAEEVSEIITEYEDKAKGKIIEKLKLAKQILSGMYEDISLEPASKTPIKSMDSKDYIKAYEIINFAININPENQHLIEEAYNLVKPFCKKFKLEILQKELVSFDDLLIKARNLIKQNKLVRAELKEKFKTILIDEFQDTDPVQGELLMFLSEQKNNFSVSSAKTKLEAGKLFVVGDPKQSIYRFRGADISAYDFFTQTMQAQGAQKCLLQTNFRSSVEIVETANFITTQIMKKDQGYQPKYEDIFPNPQADTKNKSVEFLVIDTDDKKVKTQDLRHNQAEQIAVWIDKHKKDIKLKDIAILFRSQTESYIYLDALKRYGINYVVQEDKSFYKSQEINDLINVLKTINNPYDKISLTGVLRSPFGGFSDEDIYSFKKNNLLNYFSKVPSTNKKLKEFYTLLSKYNKLVGRVSLKDLINKIFYETFFIELCTRAYNSEQSLSNIFKFFDISAKLSETQNLTLSKFILMLEKFTEQQKEGESPLSDEGINAVNILTVHKAKGLEFPVVIMADISKEDKQTAEKQPSHLYSWSENMHGLKLGSIRDLNLTYLEQQDKKHRLLEEIRILYVALTRAKDRLVLVGNINSGKDSFSEILFKASAYPNAENKKENIEFGSFKLPINYFNFKNPQDFIYKTHNSPAEQNETLDITEWQKVWDKRVKKYDDIKEQKNIIAPSTLIDEEEEQLVVENIYQEKAKTVGEICHKVMELSNFKEQIDIKDVYKAMRFLNFEIAQHEQEIKESFEILNKFSKTQTYQNLKTAKVLDKEMPFSFVDETKIINGVMDLVFEDSGKIILADYKSDKHQSADKYKPQMDLYRKAGEKIFKGKKIECRIIFLRTSEVQIL
ncbi:MAG: UvrD-helicase domain-containing protein [Elusimicrobiaceae bacterium]|jgi:ATP-dependent helicase/nuclease subunit A|nr:UvrD-helicase domain-containing protein [Elusimicrobiaceae bacterium]MBT3955665.1 UvrD-helicase domain-containing protein [Elusimicrobiaceae bacterium]MBT4008281.1 UvrD-helicase domain-containing protein [Elusimicrobiaceae bacterium]MBT5987997.1 UvrD-helicase domain-containing protein [Elusimicrobiaceae bacterium]MBT6715223.1 UvrD-helicase domain-containing protein [Elusimicrobiaceae bacterium]